MAGRVALKLTSPRPEPSAQVDRVWRADFKDSAEMRPSGWL